MIAEPPDKVISYTAEHRTAAQRGLNQTPLQGVSWRFDSERLSVCRASQSSPRSGATQSPQRDAPPQLWWLRPKTLHPASGTSGSPSIRFHKSQKTETMEHGITREIVLRGTLRRRTDNLFTPSLAMLCWQFLITPFNNVQRFSAGKRCTALPLVPSKNTVDDLRPIL